MPQRLTNGRPREKERARFRICARSDRGAQRNRYAPLATCKEHRSIATVFYIALSK